MKDLIAFIEAEEASAEIPEVEEDRQKALDYYLRKPFGNEVEGRSQVVQSDVADTIEWIKPAMLKIFTSGDEVVEFTPRGPEDVQAAKQETGYVNYQITQKNNWFMVAHDWFTDAMLAKNGYVKATWEEEDYGTPDTYEISEEELALMVQNSPDIQILAAEPTDDGLLRVTLQDQDRCERVKLENLRPENVLVSDKHRGLSLQDCPFVEHWEYKSLSELRSMGFEVEDDISDATGSIADEVDNARRDEVNPLEESESTDPASRRVKTREIWCLYDQDGDGIAERLHVIVVGRKELLNEPASLVPVAALTPTRLPHRHIGQSVAEWVMDLQLIRSTLLRQGLDNNYLANNGRIGVNINNVVNLDDLLTSRPGGIIRFNGNPGENMLPINHPTNGLTALQMIQYMDTVREKRTGVSGAMQGIDPNALNRTATEINAAVSGAQQRIELMARMFAETGVKELFHIVHMLASKHAKKPQVMKMDNNFIAVDPREWKTRKDMTVSVGLGMGNKDQQVQHMQLLAQMQAQGLQIGVTTPQNIYNTAVKFTQALGYKDAETFWTDPAKQPPRPPQDPPEVQKAKIDAQVKTQTAQADMQLQSQKDQATLQAEREKMAMEVQLEREKMMAEIALEREKMQMQMQLEAEKAAMQAANAAEAENRRIDGERETQSEANQIEGLKTILQEAKSSEEGRKTDMIIKGLEHLIAQQSKPRKVVRDTNGRVSGIE